MGRYAFRTARALVRHHRPNPATETRLDHVEAALEQAEQDRTSIGAALAQLDPAVASPTASATPSKRSSTSEPSPTEKERTTMLRNTLKTTALLAALGGLIVTVAGVLGGGSTTALIIGTTLALAFVGGSYWFSDRLALRSAQATVIGPDDHPQLYWTVARLAERAGMPTPTVAISPEAQPNAFATGRNPNHAVVCATEGLLQQLPPDEVEAVMAHELMHIKHRDILIGSVAAAIATAISFVANIAIWATAFGSNDDEDANPLALLVAALLAPIAAALLQMAISRSREFDADRGAAELIGSGEPLARALRRIEALADRAPMDVNPAQAHAYIHNPLASHARRERRGPDLTRLFSTHPATEARIERLLTGTSTLRPGAN